MKTLVIIFGTIIGIGLLGIFSLIYYWNQRTGYIIEAEAVYFGHFDNVSYKFKRQLIKKADPAYFESLGYDYGLDDKYVYHKGVYMTDGDPDTFEIIDGKWKYSRDRYHVYYGSFQISDFPEQFASLGHGYGTDGRYVYYCRKILTGADPQHFHIVAQEGKQPLATDGQLTYLMGRLQ